MHAAKSPAFDGFESSIARESGIRSVARGVRGAGFEPGFDRDDTAHSWRGEMLHRAFPCPSARSPDPRNRSDLPMRANKDGQRGWDRLVAGESRMRVGNDVRVVVVKESSYCVRAGAPHQSKRATP